MGAFHLVTQVSVFVTYWMPRKIERRLCRLMSLRLRSRRLLAQFSAKNL